MKKTTFFKWDDGDVRWTPFLIIILIGAIVGVATIGRHMWFGLTEKFMNRGIWTVLGLGASAYLARWIDKKYSRDLDLTGLKSWMFVLLILFYGGLLGPYVGLREDRVAGIPDYKVYHANGKVANAWDSSNEDFYFKTYKVSPEDSIYIVTYGEEPGYNWNWRSVIQAGDAVPSTAPRANEDTWRKPKPVETQKIKNP